jgi:hypothetical protein
MDILAILTGAGIAIVGMIVGATLVLAGSRNS